MEKRMNKIEEVIEILDAYRKGVFPSAFSALLAISMLVEPVVITEEDHEWALRKALELGLSELVEEATDEQDS
jgi:hypothetical protein